jgi:hypothetical protein
MEGVPNRTAPPGYAGTIGDRKVSGGVYKHLQPAGQITSEETMAEPQKSGTLIVSMTSTIHLVREGCIFRIAK